MKFDWEKVQGVLTVLLLFAIVGALFFYRSPVNVSYEPPVVNVQSPTAYPQMVTGGLAGESGLTASYLTFLSDTALGTKNAVPVVRYPTPSSVVVENGRVSYALMNGSISETGGQGIQAFNGTLSPSVIPTMTLTSLDNIAPQFTALSYVAANVTGAPTVNFSSNISVNNYVPVVLLRIQTPSTRFLNVTVQIGVNSTNNSAPGILINTTALIYNFTLGGYQMLNVSGISPKAAAMTANLTYNGSLNGNLSGQLVSPSGTIYIVLFPGNATLAGTTLNSGSILANGTNTTIQLNWVSANFYSNSSTANYTLNFSISGASAAANVVNYTIFGKDTAGNYRSENRSLTSTGRYGTLYSIHNYTEIYLITKNTSAGNLSVRDINGVTLVTLNDSIIEAYPTMYLNGTQNYPTNHSLTSDAVDVSACRYVSAYLNVSDIATAMAASWLEVSPDNSSWANTGYIGGTLDNNARYLVSNDTAARYVRVRTTSLTAGYLGAQDSSAAKVYAYLSCKA